MERSAIFAISCEGLTIGHTAFETRGLPRGILRGVFCPTPEYERVRPLFRADSVAHARAADPDGETLLRAYYVARDRLAFEVFDSAGRPVPVEYVHVYEPRATGDGFEVLARLAVLVPRPRGGRRWRRSRP